MLSLKQKLEVLKNIEKEPIDLALTDKFVDLARNNAIAKPILSKIFLTMTELDLYISVMYDMLSEEEWNTVSARYDTPIEVEIYAQLRGQIHVFLDSYVCVDRHISEFEITDVLNALEPCMLYKTKNVQFLLFRLCLSYPKEVFSFLYLQMKKNFTIFLPYYVSLLVRCDVNANVKKLCVDVYLRWYGELRANDSLKFVLASQSLLYLCCFNKELHEIVKKQIDMIFEMGLVKQMNRNVVSRFCEIFGYECKLVIGCDIDALYYFPFDASVFPEIEELYESNYIKFLG